MLPHFCQCELYSSEGGDGAEKEEPLKKWRGPSLQLLLLVLVPFFGITLENCQTNREGEGPLQSADRQTDQTDQIRYNSSR